MSISSNDVAMAILVTSMVLSCVVTLFWHAKRHRELYDYGVRQTVQKMQYESDSKGRDVMREIAIIRQEAEMMRREAEMMRGLPSVADNPRPEPPPTSTPPPSLELGERHLDL